MSSNPSATGKDFFTIDPRRCALVVIDMQNAFVAEGAVFETPRARAMIPRPTKNGRVRNCYLYYRLRTLTLSPSSRLIAVALS
jgi:hypothetical protein